MITVHGRYPSETRRRHGPANLDAIKRIRESVSIPVVSNGNIRCQEDIQKNLAFTGAKGIMTAEAILRNPAIFKIGNPQNMLRVKMAKIYLHLCDVKKPPIRWASQHVLHIFEELFDLFLLFLHFLPIL